MKDFNRYESISSGLIITRTLQPEQISKCSFFKGIGISQKMNAIFFSVTYILVVCCLQTRHREVVSPCLRFTALYLTDHILLSVKIPEFFCHLLRFEHAGIKIESAADEAHIVFNEKS